MCLFAQTAAMTDEATLGRKKNEEERQEYGRRRRRRSVLMVSLTDGALVLFPKALLFTDMEQNDFKNNLSSRRNLSLALFKKLDKLQKRGKN